MNIAIILIAIIGGFAGFFSTAYLTLSLPAVLVWKLYRKIRLGIPVMK